MRRVAALAFVALLSFPHAARAGTYSDDLSRCLVASTTLQDKTALIRWAFATVALHPAVADMATVAPAVRDGLNRHAAQLVQRLLTDSCRKQAQAALQSEGPAALQQGFQTLGQVSLQELVTNEAVRAGFSGLMQFVDIGKLMELFLQ